ncbi:uncharacterized protein PGTG_16080 [Puccinia graminis f. sp. tritici CRL 75-36-700-3]|uniref:SPX domain-containing protein n=1 Tax=Puccinia graminis f. sp. tritici (strain CRL 75-36-700-3 / race SCCL) TaxID=418459 RepID=E3L1R8_PUCGT|nr:uncharacterized protein PGTG_16080 [Puccinia graminis f. sp. tritici CRL 75-36-700-3]EFP90493.1 hypothetical protein PGTG_16080 [Puccinia graminis f. sp. tritici CRL 75-36-700-3]
MDPCSDLAHETLPPHPPIPPRPICIFVHPPRPHLKPNHQPNHQPLFRTLPITCTAVTNPLAMTPLKHLNNLDLDDMLPELPFSKGVDNRKPTPHAAADWQAKVTPPGGTPPGERCTVQRKGFLPLDEFSHSLLFSTVPEWQSYYVSYDSLKATIYKIEKDQAHDQYKSIHAGTATCMSG